MRSAKQGITWKKWFYRPLEIPATKKTIHPTTSDINLETLGKFRSLSFLLSLLLCCCGRVTLQSTSPHCRGKGKSTGVSRIFGEDCRHCVVPCQNADVLHNLSTSYGAWNLSSISSTPEGSWISVIRIYCSYMEWSYTDFSYNPRCILLIGCGVYISVTLLPSAACSRVYNQGRRLIE